jgi:hypothetical protein
MRKVCIRSVLAPRSRSIVEFSFHVPIQVSEVLRPGGKFVSISFGQPHFRSKIFARSDYDWSFGFTEIGDSFHFYVYQMVKGERLDPKFLAKEGGPRITLRESVSSDDESEEFLNAIDIS